jgi:hypothetical protein
MKFFEVIVYIMGLAAQTAAVAMKQGMVAFTGNRPFSIVLLVVYE